MAQWLIQDTLHSNKHIVGISSYPSPMAKCQKHVSIQGVWLLSMVLLASSVVGARIINGKQWIIPIFVWRKYIYIYSVHSDRSACNSIDLYIGQTKEDINTKSVTINTARSASYIIGSGGELNRGPCVVRNHFFWCKNIGYPTMSECLKNCPSDE